MITSGERMVMLAEIIRVSAKGATETEISKELSLSQAQAQTHLRFLRSKKLLVFVDGAEITARIREIIER